MYPWYRQEHRWGIDKIDNKSTQDRGFVLFLHILNEILWYSCILKYGNNLKLETIDYIFRKTIMLNEVNILESPNEYYQKQV